MRPGAYLMNRNFTKKVVWGMASIMLLASSNALWAAQHPDSAGLSINAGMAGSWANASIPGQGLFIDVDPSTQTLFLAWFTYTAIPQPGNSTIGSPSNKWFVAVGNYQQASTEVELTLIETDGGIFDQASIVNETEIGSLLLRFSDCETASMEFNFDDGSASGTIDLARLTSGEVCESIISN